MRSRAAAAARAVSIVFAAVLWLAPLNGAQAQTTQAPQTFTPEPEDPEAFPDKPGRDDAFYSCGACHGFKLVANQGFSRERWSETMDLMTEKHGAPKFEGKDRELILDYLASAFPEKTSPNRGFRNPFVKE